MSSKSLLLNMKLKVWTCCELLLSIYTKFYVYMVFEHVLYFVLVLPKKNSVFAIEVNGHLLNIYGNNFLFRPSERSVRKFKTKPSIDL